MINNHSKVLVCDKNLHGFSWVLQAINATKELTNDDTAFISSFWMELLFQKEVNFMRFSVGCISIQEYVLILCCFAVPATISFGRISIGFCSRKPYLIT